MNKLTQNRHQGVTSFWQFVELFKHEKPLLAQILKEPGYEKWARYYNNYPDLLNQQSTNVLNLPVPPLLIENALQESKQYVWHNHNEGLIIYSTDPPKSWQRHKVKQLSFLNAWRLFGAQTLIKSMEKLVAPAYYIDYAQAGTVPAAVPQSAYHEWLEDQAHIGAPIQELSILTTWLKSKHILQVRRYFIYNKQALKEEARKGQDYLNGLFLEGPGEVQLQLNSGQVLVLYAQEEEKGLFFRWQKAFAPGPGLIDWLDDDEGIFSLDAGHMPGLHWPNLSSAKLQGLSLYKTPPESTLWVDKNRFSGLCLYMDQGTLSFFTDPINYNGYSVLHWTPATQMPPSVPDSILAFTAGSVTQTTVEVPAFPVVSRKDEQVDPDIAQWLCAAANTPATILPGIITRIGLYGMALPQIPAKLAQATALQNLWLVGCGIEKPGFGLEALAQLHTLALSENRLEALSLAGLTKLTYLYLQANRFAQAPAALNELEALQELNLGFNQLSTWQQDFALPALQHLDLANNHLSQFTLAPGALPALQHLDLSSNQLSALPKSLGQCTTLKHLNLAGNALAQVPECLQLLPHLETLYLQGNPLSSLPAWLGQLPALQHLYLGGHINLNTTQVAQWCQQNPGIAVEIMPGG